MKFIIILLLPSLLKATSCVVSGITIDFVSHSDARITWTIGSCTANAGRIRYGSTTSYDSGTLGGIITNVGGPTGGQFGLSGLVPNTLYHFAPQASDDGGATWSTVVDATLTTLALPNPHPALPVGPPAYTPTFPNTAGYNIDNTITTCAGSQFQTAINAAITLQPSNGTVINIPAGVVCSGNFTFPQDSNAAIKQFTVTGSTLNITAHGYSNNQALVVTANMSAQPGGQYDGALPGPLIPGEIYYATGVTTNSLQLSKTSGGSAVTLLDAGTATKFWLTQWPPYNRNAIVIQTSTADSAFTPAGVRTSPAWQPQMATIQVTGTADNTPVNAHVAISTMPFTHDIWFRGIEITNADQSALATTSNDPAPTFGYLSLLPDNSYLTFDRCYIHGLGVPNRVKAWITPWAGHYVSFINSDMRNLTNPKSFPHPGPTAASPGLVPSISAGVLTIQPGSTKLIKGTTCYIDGTHGSTSGLTFTNTGGSASGVNGIMEIGLDCTPHLILPTGSTATCTGNANDGTTNRPCTIDPTQASPVFTLDSTGNAKKNFEVTQFPITAGAWGAAASKLGNAQDSYYSAEGTQSVYAGSGRGPYYLINNFTSGAGDIWHMDDQTHGYSATTELRCPSGYLYQRNIFDAPLSTIPDSPWSDGYWYSFREWLEWKTGCNILVTGNIFQGAYIDISPYSGALWSANSTYLISDIEVAYNTFRNNAGSLTFISVPHGAIKSPPINRVYVHDNITENQNAWIFRSTSAAFNNSGIWMTHGYLMEDMIVDHNTVVDVRGTESSMFHLIQTPQEGTRISNNIFWANDDNAEHGWGFESTQTNTPGNSSIAKAGMDNVMFSGTTGCPSCAPNTNYSYAKNLLVPQYTNSQLLTGDAGNAATWTSSGYYNGFTGANSVLIPSGNSPAARVNALGFLNFCNGCTGNDFRFPYNGTYVNAGNDGSTVGANLVLLERNQGTIKDQRSLNITTTSFSAAFYMQDPGNTCTIIYGPAGTAVNSMTSRTTDSSNTYARSVSVTSLTTGTTYDWYVGCVNSTLYGPYTVTTH